MQLSIMQSPTACLVFFSLAVPQTSGFPTCQLQNLIDPANRQSYAVSHASQGHILNHYPLSVVLKSPTSTTGIQDPFLGEA